MTQTLEKSSSANSQSVNTKSPFVFYGGKTRKYGRHRHTLRRPLTKTGTHGRGAFLRNWSKQQPGYHERTVMFRNCGQKCFLGPNKTFPICTRNTCKKNRKGVYAAYIRAKEYITITGAPKYRRISSKAQKLLRR